MVDAEKSRSLRKLDFNSHPRCSPNSLSPMTDLAHNLGGLSTGCISTPKRRFSWSNISTPGSVASEDSISIYDNKDDSPSSTSCKDPSSQETRLFKDVTVQNTSGLNRPKPSSFNLPSTPVTCFLSSIDKENIPSDPSDFPLCNCSACQQDPIDTASSQDSGYCGSQTDKDCIASTKTRFNWENVNPCRKARSSSFNSPSKNESRSNIRCKRFSCADFIEEDFLEGFQANDLNEDTQFPAGISKLLESPLSFSGTSIGTEDLPPSTYLLRKFSEPTTQASTLEQFIKDEDKQSFKRPDPPQQEVFQIHHKRRRKAMSFSVNNQSPLVEESQLVLKPKRSPNLQRSHSETDATIARALQRSYLEPDLIGDFTRPYALPLVVGRHQDLKSVAPHTVKQLLEGKFQDSVDSHVIVDCRYPYEYEAGHIKGARNIYTKEGIIKEFLSNPPQNNSEQNNSRCIIIFHCEFSSERGPNLTRFLRNKDREVNKDCYPALHYPEIYLLNGGYKAFYENCKIMCEPQDYKPMHHKDHEEDLKRFRSKSKSWNAESKARLVVRPGLNF